MGNQQFDDDTEYVKYEITNIDDTFFIIIRGEKESSATLKVYLLIATMSKSCIQTYEHVYTDTHWFLFQLCLFCKGYYAGTT